jgi:hypothetical protein
MSRKRGEASGHTARRLDMTTLGTPDICLISKGEIKKRAAVWAEEQRA